MNQAAFESELVCVMAPDGAPLEGTLTKPKEPKSIAIFISHGTAGAHNRRVAGWFGPAAAAHSYTTLALNHRDHDSPGEDVTFEDNLEDIRLGMDLLERAGYARVFLCGHSKGTLYPHAYVALRGDKRVVAIGLLGAVHDNADASRTSVMGDFYDDNVALAQKLVAEGRGRELVEFGSPLGFPMRLTSVAMLSVFGPDTQAVPMRHVATARVPTISCWSSTDTVLTPERYHHAIVKAARAAQVPIEHIVIEDVDKARDPSDGHAFFGMEKQTMARLVAWLESTVTSDL